MEILMPKVGLTMTEGTIVQWHKQPGERVGRGELLFTFETEKSTLEFESPGEGVLAEIRVPAGQAAACLAPVAVLERPAMDVGRRTTDDERRNAGARRLAASPRAKARARELGVDLAEVAGSAPGGVIVERDVVRATGVRPHARATPVAERMAAEMGVDLSRVAGSGPGGRVTRQDVERAAEVRNAETPATSSASPGAVPLPPARRVTAQRLTENARAAPHVSLFTEADATSLVSAREQLGAELGEKVSYDTLLIAIAARALREQPHMNASWVDGAAGGPGAAAPGVLVHDAIHIGVAVDTPRGLYVPVVRDAGSKSLLALHRDVTALVARAVSGEIGPDELSGGTFTLTNLGMYEVDAFTPILNLPEAAILGVGRIAAKPAARGELVVVRQMMALSLSFDHRVVDGAPAARFLQRVKALVERPFALLA